MRLPSGEQTDGSLGTNLFLSLALSSPANGIIKNKVDSAAELGDLCQPKGLGQEDCCVPRGAWPDAPIRKWGNRTCGAISASPGLESRNPDTPG